MRSAELRTVNRPRLNEDENLRSLRLFSMTKGLGILERGLSPKDDGSLAMNSRSVCASCMLSTLTEHSLRAACRMPVTADFRLRTFSDDDIGDLSSTEVGGVDGVEAFESPSVELLGVDKALRWRTLVVSNLESLEVGGL